jgi:hypothetical protein
MTFDQHLAIGRLGIGAFDFDQGVDARTAFWQLIGTHVLSFPEADLRVPQ